MLSIAEDIRKLICLLERCVWAYTNMPTVVKKETRLYFIESRANKRCFGRLTYANFDSQVIKSLESTIESLTRKTSFILLDSLYIECFENISVDEWHHVGNRELGYEAEKSIEIVSKAQNCIAILRQEKIWAIDYSIETLDDINIQREIDNELKVGCVEANFRYMLCENNV